MSAHLKRGLIVWILAFLTFLAAINTLYAVLLGTEKDFWEPVNPYLIRYVIPNIPLHFYFWISVAATCALLAATCIIAFRRLPDPHLFWKIDKLEENIADNAETIRATQTSLLIDIENNKKAREEFTEKINTTLGDARRETLSTLERHEKAIQETNKNLQRNTKEIMSKLEEEHSKSIQQMNTTLENRSKETHSMLEEAKKQQMTQTRETHSMLEEAMKQQMARMTEVTERVESLKQKLLPQSKLTSQDKPEDVKGIGPQLGKELKAMGITTVAELITADPRTVAQGTRATRDAVRRLQTIAQLQMIPGIEENYAELLEEAGVTTREDLARQDPILLSQKMEAIAKSFVEQGRLTESEKPTFEEIVSWIRQAKI